VAGDDHFKRSDDDGVARRRAQAQNRGQANGPIYPTQIEVEVGFTMREANRDSPSPSKFAGVRRRA